MKAERPRGKLTLRQLQALFAGAPPMALHHFIHRDPKPGQKGNAL